MRIALGVEYCGTAFRGWQSQAGGGTVQDALEAALARIAGGGPGCCAPVAPMPGCMPRSRSCISTPTRSGRSRPGCAVSIRICRMAWRCAGRSRLTRPFMPGSVPAVDATDTFCSTGRSDRRCGRAGSAGFTVRWIWRRCRQRRPGYSVSTISRLSGRRSVRPSRRSRP